MGWDFRSLSIGNGTASFDTLDSFWVMVPESAFGRKCGVGIHPLRWCFQGYTPLRVTRRLSLQITLITRVALVSGILASSIRHMIGKWTILLRFIAFFTLTSREVGKIRPSGFWLGRGSSMCVRSTTFSFLKTVPISLRRAFGILRPLQGWLFSCGRLLLARFSRWTILGREIWW